MGSDNPPPTAKGKRTVADFQPKLRTCLGTGRHGRTCGVWFKSQGPGNRRCPACQRREDGAVRSRRDVERMSDTRGKH